MRQARSAGRRIMRAPPSPVPRERNRAPPTCACPTHRSDSARRTGRSGRRRSRPSPSPARSASAPPTRTAAGRDWRRAPSAARADLASSPFGAIVRQSTGQMSMQASHSMQAGAVKCVCTSQFRQRSTSAVVCSGVNPVLHLDGHVREAQRHIDVHHLLPLSPGCSCCCTPTRAAPSWCWPASRRAPDAR